MSSTTADPTTLDAEAVKLALHCVDTVMRFQAYTLGMRLVMLLGKFRDDIREAHGKGGLQPPRRGSLHLPLRELAPGELDTLANSVDTLQDQFAPFMDDPELADSLAEFRGALRVEEIERAKPGDEATASAKAL